MICRPFRVALLVGALVVGTVSSARADQKDNPAPANPCMQTIKVVECVPENYTTKRIAYKRVCKEEKYTAYKCISEPVTKKRTVTVYVRKQVMKDVTRTVYDRVPVTTTKTVMRTRWTTQQVTEMRSRRVDRGSYVNEEVSAPFQTFSQRLNWRLFADHCCEPCPPCPATRCVKRWCSNWVTECCPVTVCKKVCTQVPETVCCTTYKCVPRTVCEKVCTTVCVPECREECYTECVTKKVAYEATRTVVSCEPYEETVTCTRMVPRVVERQVPIAPAADACCDPCANHCCSRPSLLSRMRGLFARGGCCESSCGDCSPCGGSHGCSGCGH